MATNQSDRRNLVLWVKLDGWGQVIPGSEQYRPRGIKPSDGVWRQVTGDYCCAPSGCVITFYNQAHNSNNVISVKASDSDVSWTGVLTNGQYKSFIIPNCYDTTFTVTFGAITVDAVDVNVSTVQGSGTITATPGYVNIGASGQTVTIHTTASPGSEYLVSLVDD